MHFVTKYTVIMAVAVAALAVPVTTLHAQDECQCTAPGGGSSRIANAIGGGLFAGLIAAVIPFHHAGALASATPPAARAPSALTVLSDSTDIAPSDSSRPRRFADLAAAPPGGDGPTAGAAPLMHTSTGEAGPPLPAITADEAADEGMIAPKTATMLPALAMIGVGLMLMGIFFLRVRRPRLRSR